jgi:hypothetical protein
VHAIAVAAAAAPAAPAERFRRGRPPAATAGNGLIGRTGKHASHSHLDAEKNPSGTEISFRFEEIRDLVLRAASKAVYAESKQTVNPDWRSRH